MRRLVQLGLGFSPLLGVLALPAAMDSGPARAEAAPSRRVVDVVEISPAVAFREVEAEAASKRSPVTGTDTLPAPAPVVADEASAPAPAAPVAEEEAPVVIVTAAPPAPSPAPDPAPAPAPEPAAAAPEPAPPSSPEPQPAPAPAEESVYLGRFTVTCYSIRGRTASGEQTHAGGVAVDPRVIPFGTRVQIEGVGERVANDTGPRLRGHRLDIWLPSHDACVEFGRQVLDVRRAA